MRRISALFVSSLASLIAGAQVYEPVHAYRYLFYSAEAVDLQSCEGTWGGDNGDSNDFEPFYFSGQANFRCLGLRARVSASHQSSLRDGMYCSMEASAAISTDAPVIDGETEARIYGFYDIQFDLPLARRFHLRAEVGFEMSAVSGEGEYNAGGAGVALDAPGRPNLLEFYVYEGDQGQRELDTFLDLSPGRHRLTVQLDTVGIEQDSSLYTGSESVEARVRVAFDAIRCRGDVNWDNRIDVSDLSTLLSNFGQPAGPGGGDLDGDGLIHLADLAELLERFGRPCAY